MRITIGIVRNTSIPHSTTTMYTEVNIIGVDPAKSLSQYGCIDGHKERSQRTPRTTIRHSCLRKAVFNGGKCQISRQVAKMLILIYTLLMMDRFILVSLSFFYAKSG